VCFCVSLTATAQQLFIVKGVIFKKNSPERISQARIMNLKSRTTATSDELGSFRIQAAKGDTIEIKKPDYSTEKRVITDETDLSINLQPIITLNQVNIKDVSKKEELQFTMDQYKRNGQYYTLHPSAWSVMSSPLTGLYELFGKAPANAKRFQAYSKEEMERVAINKRYNRALVKKITDIPEGEMDAFMLAFTPSYEAIREWSDYDIIKYIQKSYEYFQLNKDRLKIQKLY
jgi:hypothetical protein